MKNSAKKLGTTDFNLKRINETLNEKYPTAALVRSYMYGEDVAKEWSASDTEDDPSKIGTGAVKFDKGKPAVFRGLISYFPRALWSVAEISTFGAQKYAWNGWENVSEGFERYKDAQFRHALLEAMGETNDSDSELLHLAHEAWGALATLELYLREKNNNAG